MHPFWSSHEEKRVCVRLSTQAAMAGVGAPLMVTWQACGRDGGGRRRGQQGGAMGGELQGEGHGGTAGLPLRALCFASCSREGCCAWLCCA
jgi:hypothetical protein